MSLFKGASRSLFRAAATNRAAAPISGARRAASSTTSSRMTAESQQKLLAANLEQADPAVFNILQNVRDFSVESLVTQGG